MRKNKKKAKFYTSPFFFFCIAAIGGSFIAPWFDAHARENRQETDWSEPWCEKNNGNSAVVLADNTRPDCELKDTVIEFDFGRGMKPYECTGQALHYARMTKKQPLCILIKSEKISDSQFFRAVKKVNVPIKCIDQNGALFSCPSD